MRRAIDWFFRDPRTGAVVVAQRPNLPLVVFLVATVVRVVADPVGDAGRVTSAVGSIALAWWAALEVLRGDSPFRRVLGAAVLGGLVVRAASG
jgi:hypothetical protein